jgi:thiamine-monophosphate kinase
MSGSEFDIISKYFAKANLGFPASGIAVGIGDDCAVLDGTGDAALSMSMDLLVAGIHFPTSAPAAAIATRALAVNLSDLAAMAATPLCFTLGLSLPTIDEAWLDQFGEGLALIAQRFNCPLVGGDLTRCPPTAPLTVAIQVHGRHPHKKPILRSTAKVADDIYVTGSLGDGGLALACLGVESHLDYTPIKPLDGISQREKSYFSAAFYQPQPRIELALALAHLLNAAIDISDGLVGDLGHILKASKVGAVVEVNKLPYSFPAEQLFSADSCLRAALFGGDDYELCFTAPSKNEAQIMTAAGRLGASVTKIGKIAQAQGLTLLDQNGQPLNLANQAYDHFRESTSE